VVLEVTESRLMADIVKPLEVLTRLRLKGLELSIDDFGTGASSLEQLKRIPFNELKIDRAFVNGASRDDTARSILESSVALAKKLDLSTVAEGVEDQADWDLVASLGVDLVQGYFVCRPLPGPDLMDWLSEWRG
jgi:EAL domain-containing protein (putative c-di-GMP-specific phosphodiesterase class I)